MNQISNIRHNVVSTEKFYAAQTFLYVHFLTINSQHESLRSSMMTTFCDDCSSFLIFLSFNFQFFLWSKRNFNFTFQGEISRLPSPFNDIRSWRGGNVSRKTWNYNFYDKFITLFPFLLLFTSFAILHVVDCQSS